MNNYYKCVGEVNVRYSNTNNLEDTSTWKKHIEKNFKLESISKEVFLKEAKKKYRCYYGSPEDETVPIFINKNDDFIVVDNSDGSAWCQEQYDERYETLYTRDKFLFIADKIGESKEDFLKHERISISSHSNTYREMEELKKKKFKKTGMFVVAIVAVIVIIVCVATTDRDNRWNGLSKEEKEWYEDNYGDGQYDGIQDAIDDYND